MAAAGRFCLLAVLVVLVAVHVAPAAAGGLRGLHFHDTRFSVPQSRVAELAEYWPLRGLAKYYDKDNWEGLVDPRAFEDQTYMPAVANATECKECIGKAIKYFAGKTLEAAHQFCDEKMPSEKSRLPRVAMFCDFLDKDPKKAVAVIWMKMRFHPVLRGFGICHKKGFCLPKPPPPGPHGDDAAQRGAAIAALAVHPELISQNEALRLLGDATATGASGLPGADIPYFSPDDQCTACIKQAMQQLQQQFVKSAKYVCKFSGRIPNEDFAAFCAMVDKKPRQAFAMLLEALKISRDQLKQAAQTACQRQGECPAAQDHLAQHVAGAGSGPEAFSSM